MAYSELTALASEYPPGSQDALLELAERYRLRNEREILELAAIAADIADHDIHPDWGLEPDDNPQILEAFRKANPSVPVESLIDKSQVQIEGYINNTKGKYFEVLVRDRLNEERTLGELLLEPGQVARLANRQNEPGWDLEIVDQHDNRVRGISLKAHKDMDDIREALDKYEDFPVAVPDNLDSTSNEVLGTGISFEHLTGNTKEQVEEWAEGTIKDAFDKTLEFTWDVIPVGSALVVVVIEGRQCLTGRATLRQAALSGGRRLIRPTIYSNLATALATTGLGSAAIPAVMGVRLAERRLTGQINLRSNLEDRTADLEFAFSPDYQEAPK